MSRETMMTLEDIQTGLSQVEQWCRVLRSAVEKYDSETGSAVLDWEDQHVEPPQRKTNCPPPDREYEA